MNTILEAINGAGLKFIEFALPMLIQSSLLIVILLAADFLLRKKVRAVFRYWIWMLVLIKLMLPSSLYSPLSLGSWFGEKIEFTQQDNIEDTGQTMYKSENIHEHTPAMPDFRSREPMGENSRALSINHESGTISNPAAVNPIPAASETIEKDTDITQATATKISWQAEVFLIWVAIAAILALIVLKRTIFIRELVKNATDIDFSNNNSILPKTGRVGFYPTNYSTLQFGPASTTLQYCCKCLSFKKQIHLKISPDATSPVVCGLLRPVILLPQNLISSLSSEQLKAIFFHELAHIRRLDLWVNLLQTLLQVIYFYNPLFWLANSIIRRTREQAVDEMVLVTMGKNAAEYPETLVSVAKLAFKRPALSLRLIGVVESEDALSGRIKHMLNHPIPKTAKLGLLGLFIIIILAAIMLPMARMTEPKMSVINNGPLDIKLVAICPDGYDVLYNPNGKKLKSKPEAYLPLETSWKKEQQSRDFIFELPDTEEQLLFLPFPKTGICIAGKNFILGGSFRNYYEPSNGSVTFVYGAEIQRGYRRKLLPFLSVNSSIDYINFTLSYFHGQRKKALFTFTGPFEVDKTFKADNNLYQVTFEERINSLHTDIQMNFQTDQPYTSHNTTTVLYDRQNRRYILGNGSGHSGSNGADITFSQIPLTIDEIAYITFGEKPYEITFKNVKVQYRNLKPRTYPEYLDVIAERLNISRVRLEQNIGSYNFENPEDVIKVIDVVQGQYISKAVDALITSSPRIKIFELDEATQEKVRQKALNWTKHSDIEHYAIELGLMGKWPEFFDLAIERLSKNPPDHLSPDMKRKWRQENSGIVSFMYSYKLDELTPEQIQKLKQLAQTTDNGTILTYIFYYFQNRKSQAAIDALYEMVQDDRPWLWSKAINLWYPLVNQGRMYDTLPEEIKIKRILSSNNLSDEKLNAKADELLKQIFTPEFGKMASSEWDKLRVRIVQRFDQKEATELFINYLRQVHNETTAKQWIQKDVQPVWNVINIIRNLNLWYDVNIGNIGIEESGRGVDIEPRTFTAFQNLIGQALNWNDDNPDIEPIKLAFTGKVVDTSGKPVTGAKMIFTKMEDYVTERGYKNQRRVEVSQITTDANGVFSVVLDPKERRYELNVAAVGFLTKERLSVYPLDDGRYRYQEYNSKKDNVFVMQRSGRISGTVLGTDGKPLADAELELFANYHYSSTDPRKKVTTDSHGKFDVNGIAADPMLLSYTRLNQVPQRQTSRQEYGGLCGALIIESKEGQNLSDIVLDLSKSVCSLELEVKDKDGKPVDSINMYFDIKMPPGSGYLYNSVFYSKEENSDGIYKFEGLPPGKWHVRISNGDYPYQELDVELTGEKPVHHQIEIGSSADSEIKKRAELERALRAAKETLPKNLSDVPFMDSQFTSNNKEPISNQTSVLQGTPIIGYDVKLNFTEPNISDSSFHSEQSVAFALSFLQIQDRPGYYVDFISTGQETWPVIVDDNTLTISNGNSGRQIISESWPSEETKFEKVITLPLEYSGKKFQCPVYIELQRREHNSPIGYYWFCAYISGRLPWGSGGRIFEIVNLDQQMEFRLKGDGTDKRDAVLGIDINGDGKIDSSTRGGEQFSLYEPFTIDSKTYRVTEIDPYLPRVVFREEVQNKTDVQIETNKAIAAENTELDSLYISYTTDMCRVVINKSELEYIWFTEKISSDSSKYIEVLSDMESNYDRHEFKKKLSKEDISLYEKWIVDCNIFMLPMAIPQSEEEFVDQRSQGTSFIVKYGAKVYRARRSGNIIVLKDILAAIKVLQDITNEIKDKSEKSWGQDVEGAQIRLIDAVNIFGRSDWPHAAVQLRLEARNNGQRYLHLPENGLRWQIEVDGKWYEYIRHEKGPDGIDFGAGTVLRDFNPGNSYNDLKVEIAGNWRQIPQGKEIEYAMRQYSGSGGITEVLYGKELILESGKHKIRTAITCPPSKRVNIIDSPVRLISNRIEFEILPKEENSDANASGAGQTGVNIYLLDGASAQPLSELVLRDKPWIASEDIEMYDFSSHCIYLKKERPELPFKTVSLRGNPFVITANGQKCYSGLLWSSVSSFMPEWNTPLIYVPDFTMPGDIISIQLSPGLSSSEEDTQTQDVRIDPHIIQALKEKGQYHAGLEITLDKVDIRKTDTGSSLSYTYTLTNKDADDLYVFDPNKMGAGLFHYFNNCPSLLPEGGGRYIAGDNDKIVKTPDPPDKIDKSWFSLIESGRSMTRTVIVDAYPEISQGKYECSFRFHSPGIRFTKDQRAQFDKRVWMG